MKVTVVYGNGTHIYDLPAPSSIASLKSVIEENLRLPPHQQKLIKQGRVLHDDVAITTDCRLLLSAATREAVDAVKDAVAQHSRATAARASALERGKAARPVTTTTARDVQYTFHRITPLAHLPHPERSDAMLHRLAADPSIKSLMTRHSLSVGTLTELDPRHFTTHESKVLGLNRNAGECILLRLRTDSLDGWRDYRGVKSTLVHELAHNTYGEHDRLFWDLFALYSKQAQDGHVLSAQKGQVYVPPEGIHCDDGATWSGGASKLGRRTTAHENQEQEQGQGQGHSSLREMRARAAENRSRLQDRRGPT